jgi:hypothetical protein
MGRKKCIQTLPPFTNDEMENENDYRPVGPASPDGADWTLDIPDTDHVRFFRSIPWHYSLLGPLPSWKTALRLYVYQLFADNRPSCLYWCVQDQAHRQSSFFILTRLQGARIRSPYTMKASPKLPERLILS